MPSSSLFAQSAGSSKRVTSEELQRCRTGAGLRNSPVVTTSEGKRSSSTRKHYDSAIKGIETLQVSDERFHHHWHWSIARLAKLSYLFRAFLFTYKAFDSILEKRENLLDFCFLNFINQSFCLFFTTKGKLNSVFFFLFFVVVVVKFSVLELEHRIYYQVIAFSNSENVFFTTSNLVNKNCMYVVEPAI